MDYSVKASDIPNDQKAFVDLWEFYKKYYNIQSPDNEDYWNSFIGDVDDYSKNHKSKIARALIIAVMNVMSEVSKER